MRHEPMAKRRPLTIGWSGSSVWIAALLLSAAPTAKANTNANGAALHLSTTDYWSGLAAPNGNAASLVSIGAYDGGGVLAPNPNRAALAINPLNVLLKSDVQAGFSAAPLAGEAPLDVSFIDLTTTVLHPVDSWWWSFGDGGTSAEPNPVHTYVTPGIYTVTLSVTTASGMDDETKTDYIAVNPSVPVLPAAGPLALALMACTLILGIARALRKEKAKPVVTSCRSKRRDFVS